MKRKGSVEIVALFALLFLATSASFIFSQVNLRANISAERQYYTQHYNLSALNELALNGVLNDLCNKTVSIPITPLNNNIFAYDAALKLLEMPTIISADNLVQNFASDELRNVFSFINRDTTIVINAESLEADYGNSANILNFKSGDILHLDNIEIAALINLNNQHIKSKYTVEGLRLTAIHKNNSVTLQLDDTNMEVVH